MSVSSGGGVTAASGTFTATGAAPFAVQTASGILVPANTPVCWGSLASANCMYAPVSVSTVMYEQDLTTSGNWTVPAGVNSVTLFLVGGGGGGTASVNGGNGGSGIIRVIWYQSR